MRKSVAKRYILITLLSLLAIAVIGERIGMFDSFLKRYEDNRINEQLDRVGAGNSPENMPRGETVEYTDGNSHATPPGGGNGDTAAPNEPGNSGADKELLKMKRSLVAIVRSEKEQAKDITSDEIKQMVRNAVNLAGGLKDIVKDGQTVVIKPNLVQKHNDVTGELFAKEMNGITTDWRVTAAVVEMVRELNPNGIVYVMEGSAELK
ncbi:MAG TPA: hypothetical protein GXX49_00305 [Clostridiaceae bacterium]|nr:hypothetical protein [Clostridiaceae bacterium]